MHRTKRSLIDERSGMKDVISLKGIKAIGFHGVFDFERRDGQDFLVDVEIATDLQRASRSDSLAETIDYGAITDLVVAEIKGEPVNLIERLAGRIADKVLETLERVDAIAVTVHKPQAPVSAPFSSASDVLFPNSIALFARSSSPCM